MTFKIITLGCKVNTYESEFMLENLLHSGYIYNEEKPDIIIINTCSVTNMADKKSRKMVRRARRENKNAILVVAGCSAQNDSDEYENMGIDILIGNREKSKIVELINNYKKTHKPYSFFTKNRDLDFENMEVEKFTTHTRAFIKVQDGCNNFCSYCIIPYVRGNIRSKKFADVIKEAEVLVANGHKEIVLTGIHTGSYSDENKDLSDVISSIAKIPGLERIRISSIEITELNDKFLDLLKVEPKIANHLHIPLQSGSDTILKRMNRKYDTAYFKNKIEQIRKIRPDISITTDCIVGHPYETEECFQEYVNFCKEIAFSKLHVFPYSKRNGTASAVMPQIDEEEKRKRVHVLLELSEVLEHDYEEKFIGKELEVITEEYTDNYTTGFTSNYLKVYLKGELKLNQVYKCVIDKLENNKVYGHILTCLNEKIGL